jgi:CDP-diacylglycerol--glycerol-3-phosphate 3-phosphatidyltransferase
MTPRPPEKDAVPKDVGLKASIPNDSVVTIPNLLTIARLVLVIPIIISLAHGSRAWAFFWGFLAIGTDLLDGWFARRFKQFSELGRILDPIVDKIGALSVVLFLVLSPLYDFPLWFFCFMLARESAVLIMGFILYKRRARVSESNRAGKWSAWVTSVAVLLYILNWQPYGAVLLWTAFVLTLFSSYTYLRVFLRKSKTT